MGSLRHPRKQFQIKQANRQEERIFEYINNIWTVHKCYIDNLEIDPAVINGNHIPLHRNKRSMQKTLWYGYLR